MKENKIVCPHCGYEYHPSEIYIPDYFLGKPTAIDRNQDGEITKVYGREQNLEEIFKCDNCGKNFKVKADITYETEIDELRELDEEYTSSLYGERINLME